MVCGAARMENGDVEWEGKESLSRYGKLREKVCLEREREREALYFEDLKGLETQGGYL